MRKLEVEYEIRLYLSKEIEVDDEVYEEFVRTGNEDVLNINLQEIHTECEMSDGYSDYAISDENGRMIVDWSN